MAEPELVKHRGSTDRLSNLPDSILCHILSFLPTKYAVRTSVLSTRWRNLSTFVSNLDFDGRDPSDDFMSFVDRVLLFHDKACIRRLRLVFDDLNNEIYAFRIRGWITYALNQSLQELYLDTLLQGPSRVLPPNLFTSNTLVKFELRSVHPLVMTSVPTEVWFPSLKTLRLVHVDSRESIQRLVSGCPVLEDLEVWSPWKGVAALFISNSSLKTLTLGYSGSETRGLSYVEVVAPSLVCVKLDSFKALGYSFRNANSLVKADFNFGIISFGSELIRSNVLGGIFNVQSLRFTNDFLRLLSFCPKPLLVYHNLVHLEISLGLYSCTGGLAELLECTPKLRTLIFNKGALGSLIWHPPERVPSCLSSHLKIIEIHSFHGEMTIVEYLLKNASVLERLKVQMEMKVEEQFEIAKKLLKLPRESRICEVEIAQHCSSSSF